MKQWEKRIISFQQIYSFMFLNESCNDFILKLKENNIDDDIFKVVDYAIKNFDFLKSKITNMLSNKWEWERMMEIDKAIIISALSEFIVLKTDKKVIIDQAIITAKNYSDAKSYKFINFILDRILNADI